MPQIALEHLLVAATGLALLFYLGGGLVMWLSIGLAPYRWLIAPWAGFSLLVITTQFLTNTPLALTGTQSALVAVGLATLVNAVAVWRRMRSTDDGRRAVGDGARDTNGPAPYFWLAALSVGVFVLCVLPVWSYGFDNIIGENWDEEMYLALGEYLKSYSQWGLGNAPPNPVLFTLLGQPVSARTHAFSYFQTALAFLPMDSLHTIVPLLGLLRSLSIPSAFVFFRTGMRLGQRTALVASGALAINAFLLWITYNTFAMQVPSFGLLALALSATFLTIRAAAGGEVGRSGPWPSALWAGFFLGALAVVYHPALTAYAALAGPVAVVALFACLRGRRATLSKLVAALAVVVVVAFALSLVSQVMSLNGFLEQYSEKSGGMGIESFTSPGDAFGVSLSFRELITSDPGRQVMSLISRLYGLAGWAALAVATLLAGLFLYRQIVEHRSSGEEAALRWHNLALLAGAVVYALLFLLVIKYPYGWFKSLAFISSVLVGSAVGGLAYLLQNTRVRRPAMMVGGISMLALMLTTSMLTVGLYWGQPVYFDRATIEAGAIRDIVSPTGSPAAGVHVAGSPGMQNLGRVSSGLISYFLRDANLYGRYHTAYSEVDQERPDGIYDYTLLRTGENPAEYGVGNGSVAWSNSLLTFYGLPRTGRRDLYHKAYRDEGSYPEISAAGPLTITVAPDSLGIAAGETSASATLSSTAQLAARQLTLGLAAPTTTTLRLSFTGVSAPSQMVILPPGYSAYRSEMVGAPSTMIASVAGGSSSVYIRWTHLDGYMQNASPPAGLAKDGSGLLLWLSSRQDGDSAQIDIDYLDDRSPVVSQTLSLDIYGRGGQAHYGYWNFDVPPGGKLSTQLALDLPGKTLTVMRGGHEASSEFLGPTGDGEYVASLLVYERGKVYQTFNDIFTFRLEGGKVVSFEARKLPPLFR